MFWISSLFLELGLPETEVGFLGWRAILPGVQGDVFDGEREKKSLVGGRYLTLTLGGKASHSMSLFLLARFVNVKTVAGNSMGAMETSA